MGTPSSSLCCSNDPNARRAGSAARNDCPNPVTVAFLVASTRTPRSGSGANAATRTIARSGAAPPSTVAASNSSTSGRPAVMADARCSREARWRRRVVPIAALHPTPPPTIASNTLPVTTHTSQKPKRHQTTSHTAQFAHRLPGITAPPLAQFAAARRAQDLSFPPRRQAAPTPAQL